MELFHKGSTWSYTMGFGMKSYIYYINLALVNGFIFTIWLKIIKFTMKNILKPISMTLALNYVLSLVYYVQSNILQDNIPMSYKSPQILPTIIFTNRNLSKK